MGHHVCAHPDGHEHGGLKPTETSVTEFCYKNVNLFLEELKKIKIILLSFPNTRTRLIDSQISRNKFRNKSLFNQLGRHVNAESRKSLEIQA